jgi:hypothetical protein
VLEAIAPLLEQCKRRPLSRGPGRPSDKLELTELGQLLFSHGLRNESVDRVLAAIERQRRMVGWYNEHGGPSDRPTEHEVVAHMILPLMLALGWSEQLVAVEWHKIDLTCFLGSPTTKGTCVLVCEAKRRGHGLSRVLPQAAKYVKNLQLTKTRRILLANDQRLYVYDRAEDGSWPDSATGYLNIQAIRVQYLAPPRANAVDTIMALTPTGIQGQLVGKAVRSTVQRPRNHYCVPRHDSGRPFRNRHCLEGLALD